MRVFNSPHTPIPEVHLLSNGRYHVMITNAGGGYSRWKDIAVTRWSEDISRDDAGTFCYLRDVTSNEIWSTQFSADAQVVAGIRGHLSAFPGRISTARFRHRNTHRSDRLARRRRRTAAHPDHEPFPIATHRSR